MESNSNTPPYHNYQGNVNSVMSPAPYAASSSNGTWNPTLHTGGTVCSPQHSSKNKRPDPDAVLKIHVLIGSFRAL